MSDDSDEEEGAGTNVENVFIRKPPAFTDANGKSIRDPFENPRQPKSPLQGAKLVSGPRSMFGMGMHPNTVWNHTKKNLRDPSLETNYANYLAQPKPVWELPPGFYKQESRTENSEDAKKQSAYCESLSRSGSRRARLNQLEMADTLNGKSRSRMTVRDHSKKAQKKLMIKRDLVDFDMMVQRHEMMMEASHRRHAW